MVCKQLKFNGLQRQNSSKYLTQTFISYRHEMLGQQVTLSGYAEWPKVADAVIEAPSHSKNVRSIVREDLRSYAWQGQERTYWIIGRLPYF
jgi:hypothetical protein